jgi:hypothetical protein
MDSIFNMNNYKLKTFIIFISFSFLVSVRAFSQSLPVGLFESIEDLYRRNQLLGIDSSFNSYMIRPLNISNINLNKSIYVNQKLKSEVSLLPVVLQQQYSTDHPYGINDGSMILARGYQAQLSLGIFAKIGPLSVQLRPEYVYAENKDFLKWYDIRSESGGLIRNPLSANIHRIDLPQRFGNGQYSRVSWGQSSVRLTFDPVSLGLSNENLWWGPGVRNSLLMSNNAAGFKHLTLNTSKPIKTPVGSFEAQIVGGHLEPSGFQPPEGYGFAKKSQDWTYFSGIAVTYQPGWVSNLFIGFDRSFMVTKANLGNRFLDYFPFLSALDKKASDDPAGGMNLEDKARRDQYFSAYARWVLPESKAEIYFEFGRNDHSYDLRDLFVEPEHSSAYIAGFRKLVNLNADDQYLQIGVEVTKLEGSHTRAIRTQPIWYYHSQVPNGSTNLGQLIGAGIGPGSNLQTIDISWIKGLKKFGVVFEKLSNNNDVAKRSANNIKLPWTDLSFGGKFDWTLKSNLFINSQLTYIRSINYLYTSTESKNIWNWDDTDVNNLQLKVGLLYQF